MSEGFIAGVTKQRNAVVMVSYHIGRAIGNVKRARRQLKSIIFTQSADRKSVKYINDAQFDITKAIGSCDMVKAYAGEVEKCLMILREGDKGERRTYLEREEFEIIEAVDKIKDDLIRENKKLKGCSELIYGWLDRDEKELRQRGYKDDSITLKGRKDDYLSVRKERINETYPALEVIKKRLNELLALEKTIEKEAKR